MNATLLSGSAFLDFTAWSAKLSVQTTREEKDVEEQMSERLLLEQQYTLIASYASSSR